VSLCLALTLAKMRKIKIVERPMLGTTLIRSPNLLPSATYKVFGLDTNASPALAMDTLCCEGLQHE